MLGFVGLKTLLDDLYHVPMNVSLVLIVVTIAASVSISHRRPGSGSAERHLARLEQSGCVAEMNPLSDDVTWIRLALNIGKNET